MLRIAIIFLSIVFVLSSQAQKQSRTSSSQTQEKSRTIITDSSVIKIWCFEGRWKIAEERFKNKDLIRTISYFKDTLTIENDLSNNSNGYTGIQKIYRENGDLILLIDHDKKTWTAVDTTEFPHYKTLYSVREKADSILKHLYGERFFEKYLRWQVFRSCYFSDEAPEFGIEWTRHDDAKKYKPDIFRVCYELHCNDIPGETIEFLIDIEGNYVNQVLGFNKSPIYNKGLESDKIPNREFQITRKQAIELAKKYGLKENDSTEVFCQLAWEKFDDSITKVFNGRFRIYIRQEIKPALIKKDFIGEIYYDIWVFNPWTSAFIERKKMSWTRFPFTD